MTPHEQALSPYATRLSILYLLLLGDAAINATVDANDTPLTSTWAAIALVAQVVVRICCAVTTVGMLSAQGEWHDNVLLEFCGVFSISLIGIIACLFLRVYRVVLSTFPSRFPTVLDYWSSTEYCLLLIANSLLSLLFYYSSIRAAYRMGDLKTLSSAAVASARAVREGTGRPSIYAAVHLASLRSR